MECNMPSYTQCGSSQLLMTSLTVLLLITWEQVVKFLQQLIVDFLIFAIAACTCSSVGNLDSVAKIGLELIDKMRLRSFDPPWEAMEGNRATEVAVSWEWAAFDTIGSLLPNGLSMFDLRSRREWINLFYLHRCFCRPDRIDDDLCNISSCLCLLLCLLLLKLLLLFLILLLGLLRCWLCCMCWLLLLILLIDLSWFLFDRLRFVLDLLIGVINETLCQTCDELCGSHIILILNFVLSSCQVSDWLDLVVLLWLSIWSCDVDSLALDGSWLGAFLAFLLFYLIRCFLLVGRVLLVGEEVVATDLLLYIWVGLGSNERSFIIEKDDFFNLDCLDDLRLYRGTSLNVTWRFKFPLDILYGLSLRFRHPRFHLFLDFRFFLRFLFLFLIVMLPSFMSLSLWFSFLSFSAVFLALLLCCLIVSICRRGIDLLLRYSHSTTLLTQRLYWLLVLLGLTQYPHHGWIRLHVVLNRLVDPALIVGIEQWSLIQHFECIFSHYPPLLRCALRRCLLPGRQVLIFLPLPWENVLHHLPFLYILILLFRVIRQLSPLLIWVFVQVHLVSQQPLALL